MTRVISLDIKKWHELVLEGKNIPVKIKVFGTSMEPLIRGGKDYVTIIYNNNYTVGDIILFADPFQNRYVLHRISEISGTRFCTWGDNCKEPDGWIDYDQIWGKCILIERNNRKIVTSPRLGKVWAFIWHSIHIPKYKVIQFLKQISK